MLKLSVSQVSVRERKDYCNSIDKEKRRSLREKERERERERKESPAKRILVSVTVKPSSFHGR